MSHAASGFPRRHTEHTFGVNIYLVLSTLRAIQKPNIVTAMPVDRMSSLYVVAPHAGAVYCRARDAGMCAARVPSTH